MLLSKRVYISLDVNSDINYKYMLEAWNYGNGLEFTSRTTDNGDISIQRTIITKLIRSVNAVLVIVGRNSDKIHTRSKEIGYRNWQNFEVAKAREYKKKIIVVDIDPTFSQPSELAGAGYLKVPHFDHDSILKAIKYI